MSLAQISRAARPECLAVMGALHEGGDTVVLLGPDASDGARFWTHVSAQPEMSDGAPDPLDRWSKRAIQPLAQGFGAAARFPSDGPPYPPFISWALATGRCHLSPAGLLVHDTAGLMISFRGALRVPALLDIPKAPPNPCDSCAAQPCRAACPVSALSTYHYDVPACQTHIRGADSAGCRAFGCAARRACPVSQRYDRAAEQSAFHMTAFLGE